METSEQPKSKKNLNRRNFLRLAFIGGPTALAASTLAACAPGESTPTAAPTPEPTIPADAVAQKALLDKLTSERNQLINRKVEKPSDAISFKGIPNEEIHADKSRLTLSLNSIAPQLDMSYSPSGLRALVNEYGLDEDPSKPNINLHLFAGAESPAGHALWSPTENVIRANTAYMALLARYVLPLFPNPEDRQNKQAEIIQEWNNRIQTDLWHETKHSADHIKVENGQLSNSTPSNIAEIEARRTELDTAVQRPLIVWIEPRAGADLFSIPEVQAAINRNQ